MNNNNNYRDFLKAKVFVDLETIETDQNKEIPEPAIQKQCPEDVKLIDLVPPDMFTCGQMNILTTLRKRKTRRTYSDVPLTLEEFSFLLWSVQGIKKIVRNGYATLRTVPSAGARHCFETYIVVFNVEGLKKGIYRYLPLDHKIYFIDCPDNLEEMLNDACFKQNFVSMGAATFIWSVVPYRMEWRYNIASYKLICLDAGHLCENLYLASESIGVGTCAIAAYDQEKIDKLLHLDGADEFCIYLAPVGKFK
ncbi:MAG: nitroreductase [Clostridiaceae bacterium]|jgi:SagB-type dehydrogenase family enzyme|nr:nitroreductase [Clostridiaceae bacterium]